MQVLTSLLFIASQTSAIEITRNSKARNRYVDTTFGSAVRDAKGRRGKVRTIVPKGQQYVSIIMHRAHVAGTEMLVNGATESPSTPVVVPVHITDRICALYPTARRMSAVAVVPLVDITIRNRTAG